MKYRFEISGTGIGSPWTTASMIDADGMRSAIDAAMGKSFELLTDGRAVYGKPGQHCRGPYSITRIMIEKVGEAS